MPKYKLSVSGMHCANCALNIDKTLRSLPGVNSSQTSFAAETINIDIDEKKIGVQKIGDELKKMNYTLNNRVEKNEIEEKKKRQQEELIAEKRKAWPAFILSLIGFAWVMWIIAKNFNPLLPMPDRNMIAPLLLVFSSIMLFWIGRPFLFGIWNFFRYGRANMDTLVGLGTASAYFYSTIIFLFPKLKQAIGAGDALYFDATIIIIGFVVFGKYLERKSKLKTGEAIERLLHLSAKTAIVFENGQEKEKNISDVKIGDLIIIKPGNRIPVDGTVVEGNSAIDESMISGEAMPVEKNIGDRILAGTVNKSGWLKFSAARVGNDTLLAQIIKTMEEAQSSKAPIENHVDKISSIFVPAVLGVALLSLILWLTFGTVKLGFSASLSHAIMSLVAVLTVACPCALGLATPTAIIVGIGRGASLGLLIKDAESLEKLNSINTIAFDKTGTLTNGKPEVVQFQVFNSPNCCDEEEIIALAAAAEKKSEHPLATAIIEYAKKRNIDPPLANEFHSITGFGIEANVGGRKVVIRKAGDNDTMSELEDFRRKNLTVAIIEIDNKPSGLFGLSDTIKENAAAMIAELEKMNIEIVMISGDEQINAENVAKTIGIKKVLAKVRPQEKSEAIKKLQSEGRIVAFAGDGINDAPALAQADAGLAMATGSDIAIEAGGLTILNGDIAKIPTAIRLARSTMSTVKQNLFWAFAYNTIAIPVAAGILFPLFGISLNPVFTGIAMALSSVSVVTNSLRLKTKKI